MDYAGNCAPRPCLNASKKWFCLSCDYAMPSARAAELEHDKDHSLDFEATYFYTSLLESLAITLVPPASAIVDQC